MRLQIEGKVFSLNCQDGNLVVEEFSNGSKRWIKFPPGIIEWVSDSLKCHTRLVESEHRKRFGFLVWKVKTGLNRWGWYLELNVLIRSSSFSIFVPSISSSTPWKLFIDAFLELAGSVCAYANLVVQDGVVPRDGSLLDLVALVDSQDRNLFGFDCERAFKESVDFALASECSPSLEHLQSNRSEVLDNVGCFPLWKASSSKAGALDANFEVEGSSLKIFVDLGSISKLWSREISVFNSSCSGGCSTGISSVLANPISVPAVELDDVFVEPEPSEVVVDGGVCVEGCNSECSGGVINVESGFVELPNGVSQTSISVTKDFGDSDAFPTPFVVDVVNSPHFPFRPKKKPCNVAVITFATGGFADVCFEQACSSSSVERVEIVKPLMSTRLSPKRKTASCSSNWDRLPLGIDRLSISKCSRSNSMDVDKFWLTEALELDYDATQQVIFRRMYQFQKEGKIKIKKKVIRILEGIYHDGIPWTPRAS